MKIRQLFVAGATLLGCLLVAVGPARAADSPDSTRVTNPPPTVHVATPFAAQARAAGLSTAQSRALQQKIDREVARTGGRQVALDEVTYAGGGTVFPLPGARSVGSRPGTVQPASTVHRCPYLAMCVYRYQGYTGSMHYHISCQTWDTRSFLFSSYVNNQTHGTRAALFDGHGHLLARTMPAFYEGTTSFGGASFIKVCGR